MIDSNIMDEIIKRTVASAHPLRIILFGSAARGDMGPNSDLDLLVVVPDDAHRRKTAREIYRSLKGIGLAKDIVVVTESDIRRFGDNPSLVIYPAISEGREVYRAAR